jgi:hypothetical protein
MKRIINHGQAMRSILGRSRVIHFMHFPSTEDIHSGNTQGTEYIPFIAATTQPVSDELTHTIVRKNIAESD